MHFLDGGVGARFSVDRVGWTKGERPEEEEWETGSDEKHDMFDWRTE